MSGLVSPSFWLSTWNWGYTCNPLDIGLLVIFHDIHMEYHIYIYIYIYPQGTNMYTVYIYIFIYLFNDIYIKRERDIYIYVIYMPHKSPWNVSDARLRALGRKRWRRAQLLLESVDAQIQQIDEKSTENMGKSMVNLWKSMGKHSENMVKVWELKYPLVICYIAIEDGHLFRWFIYEKWGFSIANC
jgi:hypothetical protein